MSRQRFGDLTGMSRGGGAGLPDALTSAASTVGVRVVVPPSVNGGILVVTPIRGSSSGAIEIPADRQLIVGSMVSGSVGLVVYDDGGTAWFFQSASA